MSDIRTRPRALALLTAATATAAALAIAGCAMNAGSTPNSPVDLTVTRDFGAKQLLEVGGTRVSGGDTAITVLRHAATVTTTPDGTTVQSINTIAAAGGDGWFSYVNGILADTTNDDGSPDVHGGDRIWWDYRPASPKVRAVVGAYPEPFVHGFDGKRLPVRVECAEPNSTSCNVVANKLLKLGVPIGRSDISASAADESLRILIGPWKMLQGRDAESDAIDTGPGDSGVFARFDAAGDTLAVLDPSGATAQTLGAGSGLIAATRSQQRQPVWFVTGTDDAGVASAASALDPGALSGHYALAISHDLPVAVPLPAR